MRRGFYIGRFQPYHEGHHTMVERIADEVDELVLGIGSADVSHTTHDPFTAGERITMITRALADLDLVTYVVPLEDIDRNAVWVSHVEAMCPDFDIAYSNNPLVIQLFGERGVPVRQSPMFHREVLEGTQIRERMIAGEDWYELVPDVVAEIIAELDGAERLRQLDGSDGVNAENVENVENVEDIDEGDLDVMNPESTDPSG
jgi:nicotinamide-nucleotide adenylyltransferase